MAAVFSLSLCFLPLCSGNRRHAGCITKDTSTSAPWMLSAALPLRACQFSSPRVRSPNRFVSEAGAMDCDQVFMILTRGPFPTGEAWDEDVEAHLETCGECWRLAEALRPALEVFQ